MKKKKHYEEYDMWRGGHAGVGPGGMTKFDCWWAHEEAFVEC